MHAMVLKKLRTALEWTELADPQPGPGEIRVKVTACGVCRTDLHVVDGELPNPKLPIIPGHEIVGRIDALGTGVDGLQVGAKELQGVIVDRVQAVQIAGLLGIVVKDGDDLDGA